MQVFPSLVDRKIVTADEILDYLFATFDFFSMPETFVSEVIGYNLLQHWIKEDSFPQIFKESLLLKINDFVEQNKTIDIGFGSRKYLQQRFKEKENPTQEKPWELFSDLTVMFHYFSDLSAESTGSTPKPKYNSCRGC